MAFLGRSIFYGDDVRPLDLSQSHCLLDIHGPQASALLPGLWPDTAPTPDQVRAASTTVAGASVTVASRKPASGSRWSLLVPQDSAPTVWDALLAAGLTPAGSLTYNTLRIRAGLPGTGRELSTNYLPLEVGLWDEVSFAKGCYTGQEVIARMESRGRLAKTLVRLDLPHMVDAPTPLFYEGRQAGEITSSVQSPLGEVFAIGVVRLALARPGQTLTAGAGDVPVSVATLIGAQPPYLPGTDDNPAT
jgi:aminomethyltransferase